MKKLIALLVAFAALSFGMVGCGNKDTKSTAGTNKSTKKEETGSKKEETGSKKEGDTKPSTPAKTGDGN